MNRLLLVLLAGVFATAPLAGCHEPETAPADDNITIDPDPEVSEVRVVSKPTSVEAGGSAIICWHVGGRGTVPHTAVHFGNESHPGAEVEFGDYGPGVSYPGNETQQDPDGYELPRNFCTAIEAGNETVYFRAHAMITPPGLLSEEHSIAVTSG